MSESRVTGRKGSELGVTLTRNHSACEAAEELSAVLKRHLTRAEVYSLPKCPEPLPNITELCRGM